MQYESNFHQTTRNLPEGFGHDRARSVEEETAGMLSNAMPPAHYEAPPPINQQQLPATTSRATRRSMEISPVSGRMSMPPILPAITSALPGVISPPRLQRLPGIMQPPLDSPGLRPRLFGSDLPYEEDVAWANATQFRPTAAEESKVEYQTQGGEDTQEVSRPSKQYFRNARHIREPWRPGVWAQCPWRGLGALGLVVLLTSGSAIILFLSDGTTPNSWKIGRDPVQPQVYIAVFETVMSLLMFCALAEGVVIQFWRCLLHSATLAHVYDVYDSSFLWPAIRRAFRLQFDTVAIATISAALSFARGPFFQRALAVANGTYRTNTVFVVLGIVTSLLGVFGTLPMYYGFWEIGRRATLNPLEIVRAFGAPLFDGLDGNLTASDIAMERGAVTVRYGALERLGSEKVLRVEDTRTANVRVPRQEEIFG